MVSVRFRDGRYETWENCKIHESGEWVILWDGKNGQRDRVPVDLVKDITDWDTDTEAGLPKITNRGELPRDWPIRRQRVLVRDGFLCQNCWKFGGEMGPKDLQVHHIVPRGVPEVTHRVSNLVTLCEDCHDVIPTV